MPASRHDLFRLAWWGSNELLAGAFVALLYTARWEYSVTRYLDGFSDAMLRISRFHLREHAMRAGSAFFSTPEIKD